MRTKIDNYIKSQHNGMTMCGIECQCGKETTLVMNSNDIVIWKQGGHVKLAFPYLDHRQIETLITGLCETCQELD